MSEYQCSGWACVDCLMMLANGETPAEMSESETAAWLAGIETRSAGYEITLGLAREEHSCTGDFGGMTAGEAGSECDCERQEFSWQACDVCGSNLGGSRDAVTFWQVTS